MEIWAILSIANNYDQPNNNIEIFWAEEPTFELLRYRFKSSPQDTTSLLEGKEVRIGETDYRLRKLVANTFYDANEV